ncbi:MAG: tetratricopeptide repeat protein [Betaproteobacteria bacterium]|nr:MAG: tetratricopeptide repeat protein [Betaproteobacteria bacterium]
MMTAPTDRYGNSLSTDAATAALYIEGVDAMLSASDDLMVRSDAVVASDPNFALGHVLCARSLASYGRGSEALLAISKARDILVNTFSVSDRERGHVHALGLLIEGRGAEALVAIKSHLSMYPRDAVVLQPATGIFGLIGFSGRIDREAEFLALMNEYAAHYANDWWFSSIHAFAECEAGFHDAAAKRVQRSLEMNPRNGNAAHVQAHLHYEFQDDNGGAAFLREWLSGYPKTSLLRTHLSWHLALVELSLGRVDAAWQLFRDEFDTTQAHAPPLNALTDIVSWLWRAELAEGVARPQEWQAVAERVAVVVPKFGVVFGDAHRAVMYAKSGDSNALAALREAIAATSDTRPAMRAAGVVGEALVAATEARWHEVIDRLESVDVDVVRIGGSRAQRDLVVATLMTALHQTGQTERLALLRARRPQVRPLPLMR